jgi:hypothetical protein
VKSLNIAVGLAVAVGFAAVATNPVLADSNASGGGIANTETVSIGAGPFDHGDAIGNSDNTIVGGISFTGGFNATHIRFTGTATSVLAPTWGSEADIQIRQGLFSSNDWQNPGPAGAYSTFDYDFSQELTGDFAGGTDPGSGGAWTIEFFDSFDDGAGADSQSTNVDMIFEERPPVSDSDGSFSLGSLNASDTNTSLGEMAVPSLFDLYTITLNQAGDFTFFTDEDPNGFVGTNVDTEIGIFDAGGTLIAENDDGGNGLYSGIFDLSLAPGDYTLAVAPFLGGASFADGFVVNPGTGTGDYIISASLVPEPGTLALLGLGCLGLLAGRRQK